MPNHVFYQPPVLPDGTAANHAATKGQLDLGVANAQNLGNSTGTLPAARIADGSLPTSKITNFQSAVDARVQAIVGAAPAALDTLVELASALGNDANFASTVTNRFTTVEGRVTALEGSPAAPAQISVPALSGSPVTITHGKGRRVICQVTRVSDGQVVNPVVTGNNAASNTLSLDFGSTTAAAGDFVALVN